MYLRIALQVLYEARGPGGAGFIAAALTDNLNRLATGPQAAWISDHMSPCTCCSCSCLNLPGMALENGMQTWARRTAAEVRTAVQKGGGKMADAGSVM